MKICGYEFEYVCDIDPLKDADGSVRQFMPQTRYRNARNLPLNRYGEGPFCRFTIPQTYKFCGVYVLTAREQIRYVGECLNLSARFNMGYGNISPRNCFKHGQETNCRLNNLIYATLQGSARISLWFFGTPDHKMVEASLRSAINPPWNRV